jgi:hypothetical protein
MSAFVVSDSHINALIIWSAKHDAGYSINESAHVSIRGNEQACAAMLYLGNVASVNRRYRENDPLDGFAYRPYAQWLSLSAVAVLKLCDCLDYQSCEIDDYRSSHAAQLIDGIRNCAIKALPGYEDAPWHLLDKQGA